MTEYIASVLSSLLAGGVVAAALVFCAKTYLGEKIKASIQSEYNLKLEHFKTELKLEADAKLESLKSELSRANTEHQIRFSQLQAKVAESISEVYAAIRLCKTEFDIFTDPMFVYPKDEQEQVAKNFVDALQSCQRTTLTKLIFFQQDTAKKLEELVRDFGLLALQHRTSRDSTDRRIQEDVRQRIDTGLPALLELVEQEFRKALGFLKDESQRTA